MSHNSATYAPSTLTTASSLSIDDNSSKRKPASSLKSAVPLVMGGLSGLANCLIFQPLDLIKTRQQQHNFSAPPKEVNLPLIGSSHKVVRPSLARIVKDILEKDGASGLWRGTLPTIARTVPGTGLYFFTYEKIKLGMEWYRGGSPSRVDLLFGGAFSKAFVGYFLTPMAVVKIRVESSLYPDVRTIRQGFRSVLNNGSISGLFAGSGAAILRDAPHAGLYVYFYQLGKATLGPIMLSDYNINSTTDWRVNLAAGFGAGVTATLLTHPFDVVKTRIQLDRTTYPNLFVGLRSMKLAELTRGLSMRLAKKTLSSAVAWAGYEQLVAWSTTALSHK